MRQDTQVGNNDAKVVASSVNYTQDISWVPDVESEETTINDGASKPARNWLDGEYGSTTTAIKYPVFQPLTYAMNYINHNDAYNIARVLSENGNPYGFNGATDSHLMKNSEWGAVAYLSKSEYGLGTTDITVNNISLNNSTKSVYAVTGCTSNSTSETTRKATIDTINGTTGNTANVGVYTWDQLTGTTASCTGTIYGIYDLSGGTWEKTTGYVANQNDALSTYGRSITYNGSDLKTVSTKYTTVYPHNRTYDNINTTDANTASSNNWKKNTLIYGDAIRETSTAGTGSNSWYGDVSSFSRLGSPFLSRGARYSTSTNAGFFCFNCINGSSYYDYGFRAVVIVP